MRTKHASVERSTNKCVILNIGVVSRTYLINLENSTMHKDSSLRDDINDTIKQNGVNKRNPDKQHNKSATHVADYRERYQKSVEAAEWLRNDDRREAWDNRLGIP